MSTQAHPPQQLIEQSQNLVRSIAWKIHRGLPSSVDVEDLVAYGQVGLAEAAQNFDPEQGRQFSTFAYYRIRGAIYDGLAKMAWFSRAHYKRLRYEQMANEVMRLQCEDQSSEAAPAAEANGWFRNISSVLAVVYLATHRSDDDSEDMPIEDQSSPAPAAEAIDRETNAKLGELIDQLPDESRSLIRSVYFEGLSLREAGDRLGVSKAWASRLHAKTLDRLARLLRTQGIAE